MERLELIENLVKAREYWGDCVDRYACKRELTDREEYDFDGATAMAVCCQALASILKERQFFPDERLYLQDFVDTVKGLAKELESPKSTDWLLG